MSTTEQRWSNKTKEELDQLSDGRLHNILKRARIAAAKVDNDPESEEESYFRLVLSATDGRKHFD